MSGFVFDPSERGLRKVLKEYEKLEMRCLWSVSDDGAGSRAVMEAVNERRGKENSKSRATIILSLNKLVEQYISNILLTLNLQQNLGF